MLVLHTEILDQRYKTRFRAGIQDILAQLELNDHTRWLQGSMFFAGDTEISIARGKQEECIIPKQT